MHGWIIMLLILVAVALKLLDSSKTFTGFLGEQGVRSHLNKLDKAKYLIINDLMIQNHRGDGTSQIDHVVVFRGGLVVIETKNWAGRVYGKGDDRQWTVTLGGRKYRRTNPINQNMGHIKALRAILGDTVPMYNMVVLSGRTDLRLNDIAHGVVVRPRNVVPTITSLNDEVLIDQEAQTIYQRLVSANITDTSARKQHVKNIRKRYIK